MDSAIQPFTPEQWAIFNHGVDQIYEDFTAKVAAGRKMPIEKVREIAKGRVWSGADAKARGLVDEFGGFRAALEATKALAGIPADAEINLKRYPARRRTPFEEIAEMFGTSAEVVRTMAMLGKVIDSEPVAEVTRILVDDAKASQAPSNADEAAEDELEKQRCRWLGTLIPANARLLRVVNVAPGEVIVQHLPPL